MKKLLLICTAALMSLFVGCSQFDTTGIWDAINDLEEEQEKLEDEQEKMQEQIDAQQALINALANNLTITNIATTEDGYTITFSDGSTATIRDGKDGEKGDKGDTGEQGEKGDKGDKGDTGEKGEQGEKGDKGDTGEQGEKGEDGADGKDGEDGKDGADGKDGEDGDSFFQSVTWDDEYVYFTLSDGTVITIPLEVDEEWNVTVRDIEYNSFAMDVAVSNLVRKENHMIKWGVCNLYLYNKNKRGKYSNNCDASMIDLYDREDGYGPFFFNESTTLEINGENNAIDHDGTLWTLYDVPEPGQPTVIMFGEFKWGNMEVFLGYTYGGDKNMGYYIPLCDWNRLYSDQMKSQTLIDESPYWSGAYHKEYIMMKKPIELDGSLLDIEVENTYDDAVITVTAGEGIEKVAIMVLDQSDYDTVMSRLDNNEEYLQWFTSSETSVYEEMSLHFDPREEKYSGTISVKLSDYYVELDKTSTFRVYAVGMKGDWNNDGTPDYHEQVYKSEVFTLPTLPSPTNQSIYYTSTDGNIVQPYRPSAFGANIVSNTYEDGLGVITFDGDVTSIGESAFERCSKLASITIPDSVTSIEYAAFADCYNLANITIPDGVTEIGNYAFVECDNLAEFRGKYASEDGRCWIVDGVLCSFAPRGLTQYTIPNSVTSIGNSAFGYCRRLTRITIPDSVTSIGNAAFIYCTSLESITIPDGVTSIGERAFAHCSSLAEFRGKFASEDGRCWIVDGVLNSFAPAGLTEYTIPDSVTEIGGYAFASCSSLASITIPDGVTSIGYGAFYDCSSLASVTIGNGVTSIGSFAFSGCSSLASITIPDSVTSIEYQAFSGCLSLTSITIPDGVTSIGVWAFNYCKSLKSITIPDSVTSIGDYAFYECSSLAEVYCKPTTPPTGGYNMFYDNASGHKIYVPTESVEAYKSADGWSDYADAIVGYDFE